MNVSGLDILIPILTLLGTESLHVLLCDMQSLRTYLRAILNYILLLLKWRRKLQLSQRAQTQHATSYNITFKKNI